MQSKGNTLLNSILQKLGLPENERMVSQFMQFIAIIQKWQRFYRLLSKADTATVVHDHIYDSLLAYPAIKALHVHSVCDIGSGAGFPAIPLAIVLSNVEFHLIEERFHRVEFLKSVVRTLAIENRVFVHYEHLQPGQACQSLPPCSVEVITARAVASIDRILALSYSILSQGGHYVLHRGKNKAEVENCKPPLAQRGITICQDLTRITSHASNRTEIVVLQKKKASAENGQCEGKSIQ